MTVEPYLAALVWQTRRPVRMVWERQESLLARQKRHPFIMRYRTGASSDGTIIAQEIEIIGDAGAYPLLSRGCCSPAAVNSTGPYRCRTRGWSSCAVFTNNVPTSAFRGFGAMQVVFGYESQMDRLAARLRLDRCGGARAQLRQAGDRRVTDEEIGTQRGRARVHAPGARAARRAVRAVRRRQGRAGHRLQHAALRPLWFSRPRGLLDRPAAGRHAARPLRRDRPRRGAGGLPVRDRRRGARRDRRPHQRLHRRHRADAAGRRHVRHPAAVHVGQRGAEGGARAARQARAGGGRPAGLRARRTRVRRQPGGGGRRARSRDFDGGAVPDCRESQRDAVLPQHLPRRDAASSTLDRSRALVPRLHLRLPCGRGGGLRGTGEVKV